MAINWTKLRQETLGNYDARQLPAKLSFPVMPQALAKFLKAAENPDADAAELGKIVETDSGLTAELLKHVNSSNLALRQKVSSCQRAVAIMGFSRCKTFLLGAALQKSLISTKKSIIQPAQFSRANLERAYFAQVIAAWMELDAELAFSGAVLSDCVLPALAGEFPVEYQRYQALELKGKPLLTDFEKSAFRCDHARAASMIMLGWMFPDDLICCVLHHHSAYILLSREELRVSEATAVAVAALLPDPLMQMPLGCAILMKMHTVLPGFDLARLIAEVEDIMSRDFPPQPTDSTLMHRIEEGVRKLA